MIFSNSKFRNFQFLSIIIGILGILLPSLVPTNANSSTNSSMQNNQNIFISEVSFGGSKALNSCKQNQNESKNQDNLIESMCNFDKWIEIYNPNENTVNLDGYRTVVQNGLSEVLSGQILPKSFLVFSNNNYKYQNTQKVEENFVPQKTTEKVKTDYKIQENEDSSQNSINNSQNKSETKTNPSLEQSSTSNSTVKSSSISSSTFINSPNSSISSSLNQKINSESSQVSSSPNSTQNIVPNNLVQNSPKNIVNTTQDNLIDSQNLQNSNSTSNQKSKSSLTIELKNEIVSNKTLDFKKENLLTQNSANTSNSINKPDSSNSQIFLQINSNSLNLGQKKFISTNFKSFLTKNNNKYEALNSNITNQQKQDLFEQNIDWKLQKRTETRLNSVLEQGNFANSTLGILHSLSPNNPAIAIKNPQNQIISSRSFTANWNGQNHYTAEFESADSSPIQATKLYFEKTNFGTPGFGKIKEKEVVKIPQNSTNLLTNLPINSVQLEVVKNLESEKSFQNNEIELTNKNPIQIPDSELNTKQIGQKISQLQENPQANLAKKMVHNLSQKPATILEENPQKNLQLQNSQSSFWHTHLSEKSLADTFDNKIQGINQPNYDLTLAKKSSQNQFTDKISILQNQEKTANNYTKINSPIHSLAQNHTFSGQIFTFKTDSILNFFINLLFLLLAFRKKENKSEIFQKTHLISYKNVHNSNQKLIFSFKSVN